MGRPTSTARAERANVANTAAKLAALGRMTGAELAAMFEDLFGQPSRTRNKPYLRKRLAWRIQELAEGGLSPRALARIEELAALAPPRWRQALAPIKVSGSKKLPAPAPRGRDPRLPPPGTVITRVHDGVEHRVTALADGFEYEGDRYRSLSAIARKITGTAWNGFHFFFGRSGGTRASG